MLIGLLLLKLFFWVPTFLQVKGPFTPTDIWVVDKNGRPMATVRTQKFHRSLDWIPLSKVSSVFLDQLIQTEDKRFYMHPGFDPFALLHSIFAKYPRGGASTITMQTVDLISLRNSRPRSARRTWIRKIKQILMAFNLELKWNKKQILEAYINLLPFRGELVGLHATSMGYFNKTPSGLLPHEAALLVSLIRAPNAKAELVGKRACKILKEVNCNYHDIFNHPYSLPRIRDVIPILSDSFITKADKSVIRTSLDFSLQQKAMRLLQDQLRQLKTSNVHDGAALVLSTKTGEVLAYVANGGPGLTTACQVDGIRTKRQAGSTIKPFVYGTAISWNLLTPETLIEDSVADISIGLGQVYHPKNYDNIFRGLVSVTEALGSSLNVPAVRALQIAGPQRVIKNLEKVGFKNLSSAEFYGPSLALGSLDVTLWELTHAYRSFANPDQKKVYDMLASPESRRFTFGMDGLLTLPFDAAVKTGTSKDMRDNWCIGLTPEFTVGVWVGNFNGDPMWNVSGMTGAAPIWRSLMLALHTDFSNYSNYSQVQRSSFMKAQIPLPSKTLSRIRYPVNNMLVAFDPDIPLHLQKIIIEVENISPQMQLYVNGLKNPKKIIDVKRGKYLIELKGMNNKILDSVKFEIR